MLFEHPKHVVRTPTFCCSNTQNVSFEHPEHVASEDSAPKGGAPMSVGRITLGDARSSGVGYGIYSSNNTAWTRKAALVWRINDYIVSLRFIYRIIPGR